MNSSQMYQTLFDSVSSVMEMTEIDKTLCQQYFEPIKVSKKTIVENENHVPQHQYFVASGIMRNYYHNAAGDAITTDLNYAPRFFTSYNNFMNRSVSNEIIESVTDCELLRIRRDEVDILFENSVILKDFTIKYLEKVFQEERARIEELSTLTAEQRYLKFFNKAPHIFLNVPLQYIASYLGIKPETLSRIRKKTSS